MRRSPLICLVLLGMLAGAAPCAAQMAPTIDQIISRVQQSEETLIANIRNFRPMIEIYIQNLSSDEKLGLVPIEDSYVLGRFDWRNGPRLQPLSGGKEAPRFSGAAKNKDLEYLPDGFAAMAAPDWELLDKAHFTFTLVRREFLGETRCFVIDVRPLKDLKDGFAGRLWVEDRGYNIVRFNGINRRIERAIFRKKVTFHVDSWRVNVLPGLWLPSYIYCEETDSVDPTAPSLKPRFKSQIRLWGYDLQKTDASRRQFTSIEINEPAVRDKAEQERQISPLQSQRRWKQEAETNVLERLEKAALLAAPGDVEQVLETVINNLVVTNDVALVRAVRARVLLTSPLESFTIGHAIVLSLGLIDVLPDEASLAMMLAHELGHIVLGHTLINTQFAFADRMMIENEELLKTLKVRRDPREEAAADAKVLEMLKKSPYQDKLADAGLFLRIIAARARQLPNLIQPHLGDHIVEGGQMMRLADLMQRSPELAPERLDRVPALSLGARLVLNPWTGRLELARSAAMAVNSMREKVSLIVTPLTP